MSEEIDVVVIGGGQAGLAASHELTQRGVEHVVLEASVPGSSWLGRWDSFTVVGPNHTIRLPGAPYAGEDPDGFMSRTEIAGHLQAYAGRLGRVREGVTVRRLTRAERGGFELDTDGETIRSRVVVVATGAYQRPHIPVGLEGLDGSGLGIPCVDTLGYRNPRGLPDGAVLVVGSGQSACQIAEELVLSGRDVVMACGRAPWFPRRPGGRDVFDWLLDTPFFEQTAAQLPSPAARLGANPQASGVAGGHDVNYRTLHALGVRLGGHVSGVRDGAIQLAPDLPATLAWSDDAYRMLRDLVLGSCASNGTQPPDLPAPTAFEPRPVEAVAGHEIGSVVVAAGFRSRYTEWIEVPDLLDEQGFPRNVDGESVVAPDLHFVGVHFLRRRRSALLFGVGDDAAATATRIAARLSTS